VDKLILAEVDRDVSTITLNRPDKLNAMSIELVDQLQIAVDEAHGRGSRLIIFKGAGKSFCAGFDLSNIDEVSEADLLMRFIKLELLLQAVANSPCLTLAFAQGKVFGAGVDLFAVCKQRIATQDATFRMPGLKFGLVLGTRRFGEIVGAQKARELLQVTSSFSSADALDMNFVQKIAEPPIWEEISKEAEVNSTQLDQTTQATLFSVLGGEKFNDTDLAHLVRSAARAGLKDRIRAYINSK
jgi:enoyl-CoA hydratase